jgi:glucose-1-phosphate cytidylyltransferase
MKTVLLAGGFGTRISEESHLRPKPMIPIGGKPILWHIMKTYSHFGCSDFVVCLGYMGYAITEYFSNYLFHESDVTLDFTEPHAASNRTHGAVTFHRRVCEPWRISLINTGLNTMTAGRVRRIKEHTDNSTFMLTYGDGVGDINIQELLKFHRAHGKLATVTAVRPLGRFGALDIQEDGSVSRFQEKPEGDGTWINAGYFVLEPAVFDYIDAAAQKAGLQGTDDCTFEKDPLEQLARDGELVAYKHRGFWQPMDTLRDKQQLETAWQSGSAPWKVWSDVAPLADTRNLQIASNIG